jgi:hypothetical protein
MSSFSGINLQAYFNYISGNNLPPTVFIQSETDETSYLLSSGKSILDEINGKKINIIHNPTKEENDLLLKNVLDIQINDGEKNNIILNITSFSEIISKNSNKEEFKVFLDIVNIYSSSLGGCNCNRKSREENAQLYYKSRLTNTNKEDFQKIKTLLNFNKIFFKDNNDQIFLEV